MVLERDGSQILAIGPAMGRFTPRWNDGWPLVAVDLAYTMVGDNTIVLQCGRYRVPSEKTMRNMFAGIDADHLDKTIGR